MICKLVDVVDNAITGADAIKRAPIVNYETGIRCLRIGDVSQKRDITEWGFTQVNLDDYKKFKLVEGDVIVARTGNTIGVNAFINKELNSVFNNGLIRLRCNTNKIRPKFLYYIIHSDNCQKYIQSIAYGTSTQPNMKVKDLLNYEFEYFNILEQKKIENILSDLDKKIEINNKVNHNLMVA